MALFQSYSGGPHGASPIVLPQQKSNLQDIGEALGALGRIPEQMQEAEYKQLLTQIMMKALTTDPYVEEKIPGDMRLDPTTSFGPLSSNPTMEQEHSNVFKPQTTIGDMMSRGPDKLVRKSNPTFEDIVRKLEVSGIYKPTGRSRDLESPEEEARREGLKTKAKEEAEAPRRKADRDIVDQQRQEVTDVRISKQGDDRREALRRQDEIERRNEATEAETKRYHTDSIRIRDLAAETTALRAKIDADRAVTAGNQQRANELANLHRQLTAINNAIKSPPPEASGEQRQWDFNDPNDVSVVRGYLQQENQIMDQLEKMGTTFPYRRQLEEVEKNWLASIVNNLTGGSTTTHRIGTTVRSPTRAGPTAAPIPAPTNTPPVQQEPTRGSGNPLNPNETPEQRRNRLLGRK